MAGVKSNPPQHQYVPVFVMKVLAGCRSCVSFWYSRCPTCVLLLRLNCAFLVDGGGLSVTAAFLHWIANTTRLWDYESSFDPQPFLLELLLCS